MSFRLPQLANKSHLDTLVAKIKELKIEVVIIDPLYLCLLTGTTNVEASNLFQMGPLLREVAERCLEAGATPILVHHARKAGRQATLEPTELEDLAFAGIQEFARQWMLLSRREKYEPGTGSHRLWLESGGSAGQSGRWDVDVEEGATNETQPTHWKWQVSVRTATAGVAFQKEAKEKSKQDADAQKAKADDNAILAVLQKHDPKQEGMSLTKTRDLAGLRSDRMTRAVVRLLDDARVEKIDLAIPNGKTSTRVVDGLRMLNPKGDHDDQDRDQDLYASRSASDQDTHHPLKGGVSGSGSGQGEEPQELAD